jgi:hypothetical protein
MAIGNINGQRTRIETSVLLHDVAFHGLRWGVGPLPTL